MGAGPRLSLVKEPRGFFEELLEGAFSKLRVRVLPETKGYLVDLLGQFMSVDRLYSRDSNGEHHEEPLALLLKSALETPTPHEQRAMFRHIGDVSLYTVGFFQDSISRKLVDVDYYIGMGENAYSNVAVLAARPQRTLFQELAKGFSTFVDVFCEISHQTAPRSEKDLLRAYDLWIKTQSNRAERTLKEAGIVPDRILKKKLQ